MLCFDKNVTVCSSQIQPAIPRDNALQTLWAAVTIEAELRIPLKIAGDLEPIYTRVAGSPLVASITTTFALASSPSKASHLLNRDLTEK